jgi:dolichol-phosphate mannosyltransferase
VFEFLIGLYDKWLGRIIPTRFALFGTIGAMGVVVHMAVLATVLNLFGADFLVSHYPKEEAFIFGQTSAAVVAMTFNFILNNELTYADKRLRGAMPILIGWARFALTCAFGLLTNIGAATALVRLGIHPYAAALVGVVLGSVWNFALSSRFVWGKY